MDGVHVTPHTQELVLTLITRLRHDPGQVSTLVLTQRGIIVVGMDGRSTWHRYDPRVPGPPEPPPTPSTAEPVTEPAPDPLDDDAVRTALIEIADDLAAQGLSDTEQDEHGVWGPSPEPPPTPPPSDSDDS